MTTNLSTSLYTNVSDRQILYIFINLVHACTHTHAHVDMRTRPIIIMHPTMINIQLISQIILEFPNEKAHLEFAKNVAFMTVPLQL